MIVCMFRRFYFGFIDFMGSFGRWFGSIGVVIDGGYEVRVFFFEKMEIKV